MSDIQKSEPTFSDYMANALPPAHGTIKVLDPHQSLALAQKHAKIAMQYASEGKHESAKYHHEHSKRYMADALKKGEEVVGGLADGKTLKDIAEHHGLDLADIEPQFAMGVKVEREHTDSDKIAGEIARDHLWEDPKYYSKLKEMEAKKSEHVEVTPDGKREIVPGVEPLKKPTRSSVSGISKSSLTDEWNLLKAKISADDAFISMEGPDESAGQDTPEDSKLSPEEEQQLAQAAEDQGSEPGGDQIPGSDSESADQQKPSLEEIAQAMKDEGYSDSEIAHVLHGHVPPVATAEDHAATNELMEGEQDRILAQREADLKHSHMQKLHEIEQKKKEAEMASVNPELEKEHAKRLKDLEFERAKKALEAEDHEGEKAHKQRLRDLELQAKKSELAVKSDEAERNHKRRMLELEYEKAKLEMELDLEFKKKEMALKLKQREEMIRQSTEEKKELAAIKHEQAKVDAANPEPQDKKPVKKDK